MLGHADVVVFDRLAAPTLLDLAPPDGAERIYAGKEPGRSGDASVRDRRLLVERASARPVVVRLKGGRSVRVRSRRRGDARLRRGRGPRSRSSPASRAIAAPASAGIPVTHRGLAQSFGVVTGSTAHGEDVDLHPRRDGGRHPRRAHGRGEARRDVRRPRRRWTPTRRPRCDHPVGRDRRAGDRGRRDAHITSGLAAAASIGPPATLVVGDVVSVPRSALARYLHRAATGGVDRTLRG